MSDRIQKNVLEKKDSKDDEDLEEEEEIGSTNGGEIEATQEVIPALHLEHLEIDPHLPTDPDTQPQNVGTLQSELNVSEPMVWQPVPNLDQPLKKSKKGTTDPENFERSRRDQFQSEMDESQAGASQSTSSGIQPMLDMPLSMIQEGLVLKTDSADSEMDTDSPNNEHMSLFRRRTASKTFSKTATSVTDITATIPFKRLKSSGSSDSAPSTLDEISSPWSGSGISGTTKFPEVSGSTAVDPRASAMEANSESRPSTSFFRFDFKTERNADVPVGRRPELTRNISFPESLPATETDVSIDLPEDSLVSGIEDPTPSEMEARPMSPIPPFENIQPLLEENVNQHALRLANGSLSLSQKSKSSSATSVEANVDSASSRNVSSVGSLIERNVNEISQSSSSRSGQFQPIERLPERDAAGNINRNGSAAENSSSGGIVVNVNPEQQMLLCQESIEEDSSNGFEFQANLSGRISPSETEMLLGEDSSEEDSNNLEVHGDPPKITQSDGGDTSNNDNSHESIKRTETDSTEIPANADANKIEPTAFETGSCQIPALVITATDGSETQLSTATNKEIITTPQSSGSEMLADTDTNQEEPSTSGTDVCYIPALIVTATDGSEIPLSTEIKKQIITTSQSSGSEISVDTDTSEEGQTVFETNACQIPALIVTATDGSETQLSTDIKKEIMTASQSSGSEISVDTDTSEEVQTVFETNASQIPALIVTATDGSEIPLNADTSEEMRTCAQTGGNETLADTDTNKEQVKIIQTDVSEIPTETEKKQESSEPTQSYRCEIPADADASEQESVTSEIDARKISADREKIDQLSKTAQNDGTGFQSTSFEGPEAGNRGNVIRRMWRWINNNLPFMRNNRITFTARIIGCVCLGGGITTLLFYHWRRCAAVHQLEILERASDTMRLADIVGNSDITEISQVTRMADNTVITEFIGCTGFMLIVVGLLLLKIQNVRGKNIGNDNVSGSNV